jgi:hypothetical protein
MDKRQRLQNLETRIGRLVVHIGRECPVPFLSKFSIQRLPKSALDAAIGRRLDWLRANNEKERMGRKRY